VSRIIYIYMCKTRYRISTLLLFMQNIG